MRSDDERQDNGTFRIKKYGNRRLYDTQQSRYITLEELARIVQGGANVRVADAASGKDITRQVLTQVILERQEALDMLPVELLHVIIRTQGTLEQAPFAAFLAAFTRQIATAGQFWTQPVAQILRGLAEAVPGIGVRAAGPAAEPAPGEEPVEGAEDADTTEAGASETASAGASKTAEAGASGWTEPSTREDGVAGLRPRIERLLRGIVTRKR
jgi:polyhydroxyalkanoate synthesis repressor PhaR